MFWLISEMKKNTAVQRGICQTIPGLWRKAQLIRRTATLLLSVGLVLSFGLSTAAQKPLLDSDFETMTDAYIQTVLSEHHVAGAAVAVVKDGEILFQKGYGYADLENSISVDGQATSFQIASVTKLFTATAAMQMVEQGKLDLDTDVNRYLTAFQLENPYDTPVTLRQLLTHTSGLDDRMPLYIQSNGDLLFSDLESLEETMTKHLPPVVREPGSYCQYNVMGMALAGYLVETVSGVPFEQYVAEEIFAPLGMEHSSYGLTASILPTASKSYRYSDGEYLQGGYTLNSNHPSGAILAAAGDMAKFLLAHLGEGGAILSQESLIQMHTHQYPTDERLTGYGLGFYETVRNGYRTVEHGGYLPRFSSKLTMLPEKGLGMFIALNTDSSTSSRVCNEYVDMFYDYFTENSVGPVAVVDFDLDAAKISGTYSLDGYGHTDSTKIKSQLQTCKLECDENGNLRFIGEGLDWTFQYVGEGMLYSAENGNYCRVTRVDGDVILNILGTDHTKTNPLERMLFFIYLLGQPLFIGMFLFQLVSLFRRNHTRVGVVSAATCALDLLYLTAVVSMPVLYMTGNTGLLLNVIQPAIPFLGWAYLVSVLSLVVLVFLAWCNKTIGMTSRVIYTIFSGTAAINIFFLFVMNGLRF